MTRRRPSGVTILAAAVLVLLPALAWLQYSWLNQIADADRERRARTLQTAATQLAQDFESEMGRAVFALQVDPSTVEQRNWPAFASKYQVWSDAAMSPRIVTAVYFVAAPDAAGDSDATAPRLLVWSPDAHTFEPTPWPDELGTIRARFAHDVAVFEIPAPGSRREEGERGPRNSMHRLLFPPTPAGDAQSVMTPVLRISTPPQRDRTATTPDVTLLGFTIVRFDLKALGAEVLPLLVRRHLYEEDGGTEFAIAVVSRENPSDVIFESQPGAAAITTAHPDVSTPLLGARLGPFFMVSRGDRRRWGAPPPPPSGPQSGEAASATRQDVVVNIIETRARQRAVSVQGAALAGEGVWRLMATHRAGSLEAAVAATRTRNFALSSGILALLATAIGLIVVSARRADRLARQQLEFVAAVSHELRTPVSVINAAAGNLADGVVGEPARVKKYGSTIQTEARRLGETVERVLQLAGIAAGRAAATHTALPVAPLVEEAIAACRHESEAAGVTIELDIAPELYRSPSDHFGGQRVVGDAAALRSAIQNLVSNAIKYGGKDRWVRVSASPMGHRATRITVEDHGIGMTAEDRKHVFEPFYRGREAVSQQIPGSGLGLHLVRRIVEAHGGKVSLQSERGRGSTFTIDLPGVHDIIRRRAGQESPAATHA